MQPAIGSLVGAFRLESVVGAGRFATVYRAVHVISQRVVALKVLDPERTADPAVAERFAATMPAVARLQHPNLPPIEQYGQVDDVLYFATPLASGGSLAPIARAPLDHQSLIRAIADVSAALDAVHGAEMVHGDVRPNNVLIAVPGRLWLADLGLANIFGVVNVVPIRYQPPEILLQASPLTPASDVFSFGVLTYQLLSGRLPFPAERLEDAIRERVSGPPPLSAWRADIPPVVDELLARALDPAPGRRFPSSGELTSSLARALGIPFLPPQTPLPRVWSGNIPLVEDSVAADLPPPVIDPAPVIESVVLPAPTILPGSPPGAGIPSGGTPPTVVPAAQVSVASAFPLPAATPAAKRPDHVDDDRRGTASLAQCARRRPCGGGRLRSRTLLRRSNRRRRAGERGRWPSVHSTRRDDNAGCRRRQPKPRADRDSRAVDRHPECEWRRCRDQSGADRNTRTYARADRDAAARPDEHAAADQHPAPTADQHSTSTAYEHATPPADHRLIPRGRGAGEPAASVLRGALLTIGDRNLWDVIPGSSGSLHPCRSGGDLSVLGRRQHGHFQLVDDRSAERQRAKPTDNLGGRADESYLSLQFHHSGFSSARPIPRRRCERRPTSRLGDVLVLLTPRGEDMKSRILSTA
ncbi:MAG: hypothetical protein KatS3mg060_1790 [Dehalococcoidia bacterium]|nr:MAG: hypothetical protein KatS3mg060_1790 [Dehalococcoidia bacterium]